MYISLLQLFSPNFLFLCQLYKLIWSGSTCYCFYSSFFIYYYFFCQKCKPNIQTLLARVSVWQQHFSKLIFSFITNPVCFGPVLRRKFTTNISQKLHHIFVIFQYLSVGFGGHCHDQKLVCHPLFVGQNHKHNGRFECCNCVYVVD